MKHVPNILSAIRLLSCPFFIYVFFTASPPLAFGVFVFASLLDVADGFIARKFNAISNLGKILDPLADKMLQLSAVICLSADGMLPLPVAFIMAGKELLMLIGGGIVSRKRKVMVFSNKFGKGASFFISLSLCMMFFTKDSFLTPYANIIRYILYTAVVLSVFSMLQYAYLTFVRKNSSNTSETACKTGENQL